MYRPWGKLEWLFKRGPDISWHLIGALNTEHRSLSVWRFLHERKNLTRVELIQIENPYSIFKDEADKELEERRNEFLDDGGREQDLIDHKLEEPYGKIIEFTENFVQGDTSNVILDVSSMPKRFFFPVLKVLLRSKSVKNLLVSYTIPNKYTDNKLALNCHDWSHVPTFSGNSKHDIEMLIIGVGFEPMGLPSEIDEGDTRRIKLLFPFPAPPSSVRRSWDFVQTLQRGRRPDTFKIIHTDPKDVSDAFDRLKSLTENGDRRAVLAPFGPKPISVAMCIFATLADFEVFYTQPRVYHPGYSTGAAEKYAYWIRMNGKSFYDL